jgi:hypothetical protein
MSTQHPVLVVQELAKEEFCRMFHKAASTARRIHLVKIIHVTPNQAYRAFVVFAMRDNLKIVVPCEQLPGDINARALTAEARYELSTNSTVTDATFEDILLYGANQYLDQLNQITPQ